MYPPMCCIGSRRTDARALRNAFFKVSRVLGFIQDTRARQDGGMPTGLWDLSESGAWIYLEMRWFGANATAMSELIVERMSESLGAPLEMVIITLVNGGPIDPRDSETLPSPDDTGRITYRRHRFNPDGTNQRMRYPAADALVGTSGMDGNLITSTTRLLQAIVNPGRKTLHPQLWLAHKGTPRQMGLLVLVARSGQLELTLSEVNGQLELRMESQGTGNLVHFLQSEDLQFLQVISPRFAALEVKHPDET
ncbi:MAG: hypothetical protein ACI8RZ_004049 [Myxococcota bacterium]|jgi:hypothetical protein